MQEIFISEIKGIKIGHAQNEQAMTGCTVFLAEEGAVTGLEIRGGGPASHETELLKPLAAAQKIHAVLLSGGSAFGLQATGGVMRYLYEKNIGFDTGLVKVPLVCASGIYDLQIGTCDVWPDADMGYQACQNSTSDLLQEGNVGVGLGATVGKLLGPERMMKSGFGTYALQIGNLQVGAAVVVNALGDVFDPNTGEILAGLLSFDKTRIEGTEETLYHLMEKRENKTMQNTTLGVIITNANFSKAEMNKVASMASNGLARTIRPLNTSMDGDAIYAMSTGAVTADLDAVGTLASQVMAMAVKKAVLVAEDYHNIPSAEQFYQK